MVKTDTKIRLLKLNKSQDELINAIKKQYGEHTLRRERMSEFINGKLDGTPFGERLNEEVEAVLTDWEAAR